MLRVTGNLVRIARHGTLTLMNGQYPRPLVFKKGLDLVERVLRDPASVENEQLRDLLVRFRILVSEDEQAPATHQVFRHDAKTEFALYMLVSERCNLACTYCLGRNTEYLRHQNMSWEVARAAIEKAAASVAPGGTLELLYFGGEPLLNWPLVKRCLAYATENLAPRFHGRIKHHMTTNLTRMPSDFIETAREHGITLLVDVDGDLATHDRLRPYRSGAPSYTRVMENLKRIAAAGLYFEVRATITSENVEKIREIQRHHKLLDPAACAFPTLTPVDSTGKVLDCKMYPDPTVYARELHGAVADGIFDLGSIAPVNVIASRMLRGEFVSYGCGMVMGNTGVVTADGTAYPCIYFVGRSPFRLGGVFDEVNPYSQEVYGRFFEKWKSRLNVDEREGCKACPIRYLCGGGCPLRVLAVDGNDEQSQAAREYFRAVSCAASWTAVEATIEHFGSRETGGGHAGARC